MVDIFILNRSLAGSPAIQTEEAGGSLFLDRDTALETISGITPEQGAKIQQVLCFLNENIPNDFEYFLVLGGSTPDLQLEYRDGLMAGSGDFVQFSSSEEFYAVIVGMDWDSLRGKMLQSPQAFDQLQELADQRPVRMPSIKQMRKLFREEAKAFHKRARQEGKPLDALIVFPPEIPEESLSFGCSPDMPSILSEISRALSKGGMLVSICIDGKPLPAKEAEVVRQQALGMLPPTSRAIAEGRWPAENLTNLGHFVLC